LSGEKPDVWACWVGVSADVAKVADEVMTIAERAGVAESVTAAIEQDMGAWFAGQAMRATGPGEDQLSAVIEEMREAIGNEAADAILARAGVTPSTAATSVHSLSAR
jgi:hypothetical protein